MDRKLSRDNLPKRSSRSKSFEALQWSNVVEPFGNDKNATGKEAEPRSQHRRSQRLDEMVTILKVNCKEKHLVET